MKHAEERLAIYGKCNDRMDKAESKYGEYNPDSDQRDFFQEAEEELLDTINYSIMTIQRLRRLREKARNAGVNGLCKPVPNCG